MHTSHPIAMLAALATAAPGVSCLAADSIGSLGATFRPPDFASTANGARGRGAENVSGLRVVVTSGARAVASIDGMLVHVGDSVHGMRVTRIDAQGVALQGEDGASETMAIAPSVHKSPPARAVVAKGGRP
jgi:hypothetical protein